jgi:ferredoxin-NADP reductase/MOSC domain-containing protein YiiM/ferredoxin
VSAPDQVTAGTAREGDRVGSLLSVNVGLPGNVSWRGRTVFTGIRKRSVAGPRMVRRLNVDGDGQGDLAGHGGEQRAVLVYQTESYDYWQAHLGRDDFEYGQFGENFTVEGLLDEDVCIGDRYRIGEAEFEVTQPRVTCFRVGMRLDEPAMPTLLVSHRRPGFYLRVLTEGHVTAGEEIVRTRIGRHALSVADVDALLYLPDRDLGRLRAAVEVEALSPGWQQSFHDLLDAAEHGSTADVPDIGVEPGWRGFRPLRVTDVVAETPTVTSIHLRPQDGTALPTPLAGQFLTVRVTGAADPPPVRSYSLSGAADGGSYRISVKREPRGLVSSYLHATLRPGDVLDCAAPRGDFHFADGDSPVLLISAGIGVTPVLAMLHRLAADRSARDVWWIHTTRDRAHHAFAQESRRLLRTLPHTHEHVYYTAGTTAGTTTGTADPTHGPVDPTHSPVPRPGRLTAAALTSLALPTDATAYVCGPDTFMTQVREALVGIGLHPGDVHSELFGALPAVNPGIVGARRVPPHQPPDPATSGPVVTFARSGIGTRFSGRYGSLLELAEACDVPTRWQCRSGVCHTCATTVLAGRVTYTAPPLEPPAADQVLVCSAVADGDLVLDL